MASRYTLYLTGTKADEQSVAAALGLAKATGAHVDGIFIKGDPVELVPFVGDGVPGSVVDEIIKTADKAAEEAFAQAKNIADKVAGDLGITSGDAGDATVTLRMNQGPSLDVLSHESRLTDLAVFPFGSDLLPRDVPTKVEHVLLTLRRPVLVVRGTTGNPLPGRVAILWDGGMESATAVLRAMPILAKSKELHVIHVKTDSGDPVSAGELVTFLEQNGLKAEGHEVAAGGDPISEAVFKRAASLSPDLVVMGGYGHSRLRELVLGGATRYFLASANCPIFLAH